MPLYEYICKECSHHFELIVHASTIPACPKCETNNLDKQLSAFAVSGGGDGSIGYADPGDCGSCGDPRGPGACSMD